MRIEPLLLDFRRRFRGVRDIDDYYYLQEGGLQNRDERERSGSYPCEPVNAVPVPAPFPLDIYASRLRLQPQDARHEPVLRLFTVSVRAIYRHCRYFSFRVFFTV